METSKPKLKKQFKIRRFKSYYVVWKRFSSAAARIASISLNRTM